MGGLVTVIVLPDGETTWGVNAWRRIPRTSGDIERRLTMSVEDLIAAEAAASEADKDAELKPGSTLTRGHGRSKTLQVRLNEDEMQALAQLADRRGVPASTLARELLMTQIAAGESTPQAMIARLRADLEALASTVA